MNKITVVGQGSCDFDEDFSILDALDNNGFDVNYNCRNGYCGTCSVRLLSGKVKNIQDTIYKPNTGEILVCSTVPLTDITIEVI